jgi:SAM-dependent methyltransferase
MSSATDQPWIDYYDADYPSLLTSASPACFDEVARQMGLDRDMERYRAIAADVGGPVLELCCGTGRITLPLARDGHRVVGVDVSTGMLEQLKAHLQREAPEVRERVEALAEDARHLSLARRDFQLAICAFNSLLCISDFEGQRAALRTAGAHLAPGGQLALDILNPLKMNTQGDPPPLLSFTRRNPRTGNLYSRFTRMSRPDVEQRVRLEGWYDEVQLDGRVCRRHFLMYLRLVFRFEVELMLEQAGFEIVAVEGGFAGEPYGAESRSLLLRARKRSSSR